MLNDVAPTRKPDKNADALLKEIVADVMVGRMCVPFKAPESWNFQTVVPNLPDDASEGVAQELQPCPDENIAAALAFSIALLFKTDTRERVASLPVVFVFTLFLGIKIMITHHSTFLLWRLRGCSEATCAALASAHSNGALIP